MGSPLEGPFQAGETVNYCYFIESFDVVSEQSCQWLQGIIPSFGGGWSVNSFNSDGLPINSTLISSISDQVDWGWRTDVHSRVDNDYRRLSNSSLGFLDLCHVNDSNCNGEKVSQGDLLPAGWYAWNTSQGISHPDSTYGDGVSCAQANGPWHVCFSLTVGEINENNDLSIEMHTLSDGEIGLEGQADSSCMEDMPLMANYFIDCNHMIYDTAFQVLTCSENNQAVSLPDPGYYFWVSTGNERVSGIENGSGADFILNLNHNENDIQEVPYLIHAYDLNGCYVANYDVTVLVYPSLNIGREPLYTVCKEDSVQMNQVIDLQSQIIGDFEVDWMSENVNDWPNSFWKNDQSEIVPYTVISEAGCLFQDTVFFHVEDVIVSEFVEAFTICKDDSIGLNQIIDLESIIHDNFTVDWNFQDLEDVPDVITSFEKSDIIPFIIEGEAGCVYSDTLVIHVPHVDINVLGKDIYCSTDTISISAGYQFDEPHTKYWLLSEQDTIFASGFSRPASIFNPGITDLEFHLYTQEGCPFYDTETITIYQYPELTFNQDSQFLGICPYDSLLLQVSVDPNNFEIEWTTPSGNTTEKEIITNIPGWYYIESGLTNDDVSCMNTDSFHLEIYPAVETSFDFDPIVCEGDSSTISSSNPNYMFNWSIGSFSSEIMVPEGSYAVTVSNGEGCVNLFDFEITEQALPNPTFNYATEICEGDFTWISSEDSDLNYLWSNGADSSAILSYGGYYEVTITDDESCVDSFDVDVNVIQYPIVNFSFELIGDSLFLYNNSEFEGSCEWMLNDDLLEIGSDTIITLTEGDYVVSLSCSNGPCGDFALDSVSYVVVKLFEENELNWTVYPNPTQNNFYIEFNEIKQLDEILIYNLVGQLVYSEKTNKPIKKHLIQNNLKSGVYIVEVLSGDEKGFQKITISN